MKLSSVLTKGAVLAGLVSLSLSVSAAVFPDLPVGVKQGGGALIGETLYVGLGSAGQKVFKLDLSKKDAKWDEVAAFPGAARDQAVVAAVDGKLYVFGGHGKNKENVVEVFADGYVFDPATNKWDQLYTRSPVGSTGASAVAYNDKIYFVGGVDPLIFNGYFQDMARAGDNKELKDKIGAEYIGKPTQDYFFNKYFYAYEPKTNLWSNEGIVPFKGRAGAGFAVKDGTFTVVNGEIKPGLRTDQVEQGVMKDGKTEWKTIDPLPAPAKDVEQDGVAGSYTGYAGDYLVVAGGANFPGAAKAYRDGNNHAHKGLTKVYQKGVFALKDGKWSLVGELPQGAGYGVAVPYKDAVLFVGGETDGGKALSSVLEVKVVDGKLEVK